jgi:hypothetical protein
LFNFVTYENKKYILLLEIIKDHNYAQSRFLRGAMIDEEQFVAVDTPEEEGETASELSYLNEQHKAIHVLNKFISFDDFQQSVYTLPTPMIIVGSAGSGKTVLVLEKLKSLHGNVAYISLSKYLVDNASKLYYSAGYNSEHQEADFLSLNDYLALWQKPEGKEVDFKCFERWFYRHAQAVRINEPYRVYEEFKGVISGSPIHTAWLSQQEYMELGVKQSIFLASERERLYPLFLKYLEWLKEENLYDSNLLCYEYLSKIRPYYDYVMIDEVQDITNIQLKCILASLKDPAHFILTGDSNQIVHPNFFSWSKIKTYFYHTASDKHDKQIQLLQTNYRNSLQVVELSNKLLKIKNTRFGSIDRESNYLIQTVSKEQGEVVLYANEEQKKKELNRRTQNSTKFAVIVPDNQQKAKAAQFFKTPLIFNIQEAKGLEYENVILTDFISSNEAEFREIIAGVNIEDLKKEELRYNRAANKQDKDAEIYKFYINSFYVAITRAVKNIYIFEQRSEHPMLRLLQMQESKAAIAVKEAKSSQEEWLDEARRLEEQGKYEQAEQIRAKYLGYEYIPSEQLETLLDLALDPNKKESEVKKERKLLFGYAIHHRRYDWIGQLAKLQFQRAILYMKEVRSDRKEYDKHIRLGNKAKVNAIIQKHGVDFRFPDGSTGLALALAYGQDEIAEEMLARNATVYHIDTFERIAVDHLLIAYFSRLYYPQKAQQLPTKQTLIRFWERICPQSICYEYEKREFRIGSHSMLFFLIFVMRNGWASRQAEGPFDMDLLEKLIGMFPDEIIPPYRKKRSYINSVLALNEKGKDSPYCKSTFTRVGRGSYVLNFQVEMFREYLERTVFLSELRKEKILV